MIRFHNSLTGRKEPLAAITPRHLRMYVCGITVYDYIHIGHARMLVVFDTLYRYLRVRGFDVTYVRNITDIDDKIIRRAIENGESIDALTARFIAAMHEDGARLGLASPTHEPRATQYMPQIVEMIQSLFDGGFAYRTPAGDVLYSVARFEPYGKLSGKRLADLRAGARIEVDESKHDPLDFVLWKAAKPGEPAWDSPWGRGRPGWHIECSAMSTSLLGTHFDLHGGGMDLKFPHHENEIAQSCAATGDAFVNMWMHNGFVNIDDEKMSKSLGNFFTAREVLDTLRDPEVLRYFINASHYRGPINYSPPQLEQADAALTRIYTALRDLPRMPAEASAYTERFHEVMDDDLNTPEAIAVLQAMAREINTLRAGSGDVSRTVAIGAELVALGAVLGIAQQDPAAWFQRPPGVTPKAPQRSDETGGGMREAMSHERIDALIAQRLEARRAKNWAESDRIRDKLAAAGIMLEDKAGGITAWRRG